MGLNQIGAQQTLLALEQLLTTNVAQMGLFSINWLKFLSPQREAGASFFKAFKPTKEYRASWGQPRASKFREQLELSLESDRHGLLVAHVKALLVEVLGLEPTKPLELDLRQGFFELGMDSLMALEFRNRLQTSLGFNLPPTLTFKYPRLGVLVDYLTQEMLSPAGRKASPEEAKSEDEILCEVQNLSHSQLQAAIDEELAKLGEGL
jgi:acyl carrier protein